MYNGIGLTTPRGSGTNGYVQRNYSAVSNSRDKNKKHNHRSSEKKDLEKIKSKDVELILHDEKKKVEIELFKLKAELSKKGELLPEDIEEKITEERRIRMTKIQEKFKSKSDVTPNAESEDLFKDTHETNHPKNEQFKKALKLDEHFKKYGIKNDDDAQFLAFDPEVREMMLKRKQQTSASEEEDNEKKKKKKKNHSRDDK